MNRFSFFLSLLIMAAARPGRVEAVIINGVYVPPQRVIVYFFAGHSNMEGYGGIPDTTRHPRAWMYFPEQGFSPAFDPIGNGRNSPCPVSPFLKGMAQRYPDYYFCGIKVTQAGTSMTESFAPGKPHYLQLINTYAPLRDSVVVGGMLCMFGFVEGISDSLSRHFAQHASSIIAGLRTQLPAPQMPVYWGRYERYADTTKITNYHVYRQQVETQIELLPSLDPLNLTALTPNAPVPVHMYFDDHHYNAQGYQLWANDAIGHLVANNWDFWYTGDSDTQAPAMSEPLSVSRTGYALIGISWLPAQDNVGVDGYILYIDGNEIDRVSPQSTHYLYTLLQPATSYLVEVAAYDAAGNVSPPIGIRVMTTGQPDPVTDSIRIEDLPPFTLIRPGDSISLRWQSDQGFNHDVSVYCWIEGERYQISTSATSVSNGFWQGALQGVPSFDGVRSARIGLVATDQSFQHICPTAVLLIDGPPPPRGSHNYADFSPTLIAVNDDSAQVTLAGLGSSDTAVVFVNGTPLSFGRVNEPFVLTPLLPASLCTLALYRLHGDLLTLWDTLTIRTQGGGNAGEPLYIERTLMGDTLTISPAVALHWSHDPQKVLALVVEVSIDGGPWVQLNRTSAVDADDGVYYWDATVFNLNAAGSWVTFALTNYGDDITVYSEPFFLREPDNSVLGAPGTLHEQIHLILSARGVRVVSPQRLTRLTVLRGDGRVLSDYHGDNPGFIPLHAAGLYYLIVQTPTRQRLLRLMHGL